MKTVARPIVSLSTAFFLVSLVMAANCRFSFADDKRPGKNTITFGAEKKPDIKTSPQFSGFKTVFADIAEEVIPTVVSVIPTKIDTVVFQRNPFYGNNDPFFDFFFGNPRQPRQGPQFEKKEYRQQGLGSGVIVSKDGYILTNYHVVSGADEIEIKTHDDRSYDAEIIGSDSLSDVAVLKITEDVNDLPVAYLGDSDKLRVGDWVVAIGNPFSLTSTVTTGIVSALGRKMPGSSKYEDFIQTDAAINPGNSGGALVNIDGELIGINTMIYTRSGGYMGIGFAVPISMAKRVMEDLIYEGKVRRGWLGVAIDDVDEAMREALGLGDKTGVLIADVFKGQPADKAGIKRGDVVVSINGKDIENANQLRNTIASVRPGNAVPIVVIRKGKEVKLKVKLAERDEDKLKNLGSKDDSDDTDDIDEESAIKQLGIKVGSITAEIRNRLELDQNTKGVVVIDVDRTSRAAQKGLRPDDIIREVNQQAITSVKEFKAAVKKVKKGQSLLLLLEREGRTFFLAFKIKD